MRPIGWTSADAAGLPIAPLLLRPDEILAGSIAHAIRFTAHCTHGYIWPGSHDAGSCDSSFPPMGARFRLRAGFDISGFSASTQVVLRAFQHYGLLLADNGSDWYFQGSTDNWWGTTAGGTVISELKTIPASQFDAVDESGMQAAAGSYAALSCAGSPLFTSYFTWFDKASPGMFNDNVHLLNTGGATSTGCVSLSGVSIPFSVGAGLETHVSFPPGSIGGPVVVTVLSGPAVLASQRVQYYSSFNEVWAKSAAEAATSSYFNWFDKVSPGMFNDNIHLLNPGGSERVGDRQPARRHVTARHGGARIGGIRLVPRRHHRRTGYCELDSAGPRLAAGAVLLHLQRGLGGERGPGGDHRPVQLVRQGFAWHVQRQHPSAQPGWRQCDR